MVAIAADIVAVSMGVFEVQEDTREWTDDGHGHLLRHLGVMILHSSHKTSLAVVWSCRFQALVALVEPCCSGSRRLLVMWRE